MTHQANDRIYPTNDELDQAGRERSRLFPDGYGYHPNDREGTAPMTHVEQLHQTETFTNWLTAKLGRRGTDYPMRRLTQYDVFFDPDSAGPPHLDELIQYDRDGDAITYGITVEPQWTDTLVRAHVDPEADPADAARALRKIADLIDDVGVLNSDDAATGGGDEHHQPYDPYAPF